jgi:hypothetical protein
VKGRKVLPAIAAVASVSTIAAAATAAAATAAVTTASAAITTTATTAARAFRLRARFIHNKVPAAKILTVEAGDGAIRVFIVADFDEGESARLARETVANQADGRGADSQLAKPFLQLLFACIERKIADVKLLHLRNSFCPEP